ncbi:MAG: hypothetical protein ABSA79_05045 [Candidatus Bathyarchaeia archaeon]|jgi:hypothetical protein
MSEPDPRKHYDFVSYGRSLKVNMPLVIDEHENTHITVYNLDDKADLSLKIQTTGALVLQYNNAETNHIDDGKIAKKGNNSYPIQSPVNCEYPSGTEGECVAQVNICFTKIEKLLGEEVPSDSLSVDLYIRRKLLNVFTAMWKSANGFLTNIGSSAIITALVAVATFFIGSSLASLIPEFATLFIAFALFFSLGRSWYTRDKFLKKRLECNNEYQDLTSRLEQEASRNVN